MKKIIICLVFATLLCISAVYAEDNITPEEMNITPMFPPSQVEPYDENTPTEYHYYLRYGYFYVFSNVPIEFNKEITINGTTYYTTSEPIHDENNNSMVILDNISNKYFFFYPETGKMLPAWGQMMYPTWYAFAHVESPIKTVTIPSPPESDNQNNSTDSNNTTDPMNNSSDIQQNDTNSSSPVDDNQSSNPVSIDNSTGIPIAILLLVLGVIGINLIKKD